MPRHRYADSRTRQSKTLGLGLGLGHECASVRDHGDARDHHAQNGGGVRTCQVSRPLLGIVVETI
ncbi:hypothetical protein [Paludibacterium denitrificans]|uniref:hypothetical protein n=1 Tax=Paludibacterium denitrificans TaxID=2675226 RepID=UPI001E4B9478|nr:hypothetical protein [Paludibacterium denitrificans]